MHMPPFPSTTQKVKSLSSEHGLLFVEQPQTRRQEAALGLSPLKTLHRVHAEPPAPMSLRSEPHS